MNPDDKADDKEPFLSRWSRRKIDARQAESEPASPPAEPVTRPQPAPPVSEPVKAELPPLESLRGLESEYRDFFRPEVDQSIQRGALKKLFADPHFNRMDGLDVYIDDYSKPELMTPAMVKLLNHAQGMLFGDEEEAKPKKSPDADAPTVESGEVIDSLDSPPTEPEIAVRDDARSETAASVQLQSNDAARCNSARASAGSDGTDHLGASADHNPH